MKTGSKAAIDRELAQCACFKLRIAARAVTRAYDAALRPAGIRVTQFSVLSVLSMGGRCSISTLAKRLGLERTALTRNLGPLERRRLVHIAKEGVGRVRDVEITSQGEALLREAVPLWRQAQDRLKKRLGASRWQDAMAGISAVGRTG